MAENPILATPRFENDPAGPSAKTIDRARSAPVHRDPGDRPFTSPGSCALAPRRIWPYRWDGPRHRLPSGHWVSVRPLRPDDAPALAAAVEGLSAHSRYRRFHSALPRMTEQMIMYLTHIDHHDHEALVAFAPGRRDVIVGVARYIRDPAQPDTAEVAVVVADSWQRRGLATLLLRRLSRRAREEGISYLTGYILTENLPTISLFRRLGPGQMAYEGSTVAARMDLAVWAIDNPEPGSLLAALAAADVVLVPLAILVPAVIQVILDVSVDVITFFWGSPRLLSSVSPAAPAT